MKVKERKWITVAIAETMMKTRIPGLRGRLGRTHGPENPENHFGVEGGGKKGLELLKVQNVTRRYLVGSLFDIGIKRACN